MKKFLKIGCLGAIGLFVLVFVFIFFSTPDDNPSEKLDYSPQEVVQETTEKPIMTDSIWSSIIGNKFRVDKDDFKKSAFYYHKSSPKYVNQNWIYPYLGKSENNIWLRLKLQYEADDWLFINKVQFLIDGEVIDYANGSFDRDNSGGRIWEWGDLKVDASGAAILHIIAESKVTKVRYTGNQYHNDRTITVREKKVMKETLATYLAAKEYKFQ